MSKKEVDLHGKMSHFAAVAPSAKLENFLICLKHMSLTVSFPWTEIEKHILSVILNPNYPEKLSNRDFLIRLNFKQLGIWDSYVTLNTTLTVHPKITLKSRECSHSSMLRELSKQ